MGRLGTVSADSVRVPVARPESSEIQKKDGEHKSRKISLMPAVLKAKKFFSAAGANIKNIFSGQSAKRVAEPAPQSEKPVVSPPFDFTHIAGAGISAHECSNRLLTVPVQTVAVELIRQQPIDPQRVAELIADNPLLKKAAPTVVSEPAVAGPVEKFAHNGFFEPSVAVPVYKSIGPLRGSLVGEAYKKYDAKMAAFRFKPIKQESEERAHLKAETQRLEAIRNGISARIGAEG